MVWCHWRVEFMCSFCLRPLPHAKAIRVQSKKKKFDDDLEHIKPNEYTISIIPILLRYLLRIAIVQFARSSFTIFD